MRFLFRMLDKIGTVAEESTIVVLKFIVLRQLAVQYENIKKHLEDGENVFNFTYWNEFYQDK
jgi:hypothetical protein